MVFPQTLMSEQIAPLGGRGVGRGARRGEQESGGKDREGLDRSQWTEAG